MLLDDIINLAVDNKQPITNLLRKCVVLAHQIQNERLKIWATKELNGYDPGDEIPTYRVGAGPPSRHHNRGCPIRRGFRRMGTTNADAMWDQKANAPRVTRGFQIPNAVCETSLG